MRKNISKTKTILFLVSIALLASTIFFGANSADALTFSFTFKPVMILKTPPSTFSLIKKIQFSQVFADLIVTNKLANVRFSPLTFRSKLGECNEVVTLCQKEFDSCKGTIDQFDQAGFELLEKANIQCQNSCEAPTFKCFGLFDNNISLEQPQPDPEPIQCTDPERKACNTVTGLPGTQTAVSCDTTTGEWNYGACVSEIIEKPSITQCLGSQPTCPSGYTGSYICSNGEWISQCQQQECDINQPQCPVGYVGNYICESGAWVNYCQVAIPCRYAYTEWSECMPGNTICYRHRTNLGGYPIDCNTPPPIISEICPCPELAY